MSLPLPGHQGRFDTEQLPTDFGPCQSSDLADLILLFGQTVTEAAHAQIFVQPISGSTRSWLRGFQRDFLDDLRQILAISRSRLRTPASRV
jgi:hypothetical protein